MSEAPIVIVGAGLAGYAVARELRRRDTQTPITLVSEDDAAFYSKPLLSTGFSTSKDASKFNAQPAARMREQLGIDIRAEVQVHEVYPHERELQLSDGRLAYSKLVLAVGASPVSLPLGGNAAGECLSVNDLRDYQRLYERLEGNRRIAILGAGLIGCEFANDLRVSGHHVTVIDPGHGPLARLLPADIGLVVSQALENLGIVFECGKLCEKIDRERDELALTLSDGSQVSADLVISAVGLTPRRELARRAGVVVDKGILVNRYLQTSDADIYALGDCAQVDGLVLPYVMPIMQCAKALAQTLLGKPTAVRYPAMPIITKTPAYPLAICPPMSGEGRWQIDELDPSGVKARYLDGTDACLGFIVGGRNVSEHRELAKTMPDWLPELTESICHI